MADGDSFKKQLQQLNEWRSGLTEEAIRLPQTLSDLRTAITDLRSVTQRLESATTAIEVLVSHAEASGVAPLVRSLDGTARELETQFRDNTGKVLSGDIGSIEPVKELRRTVDALTSLLPSKADDSE